MTLEIHKIIKHKCRTSTGLILLSTPLSSPLLLPIPLPPPTTTIPSILLGLTSSQQNNYKGTNPRNNFTSKNNYSHSLRKYLKTMATSIFLKKNWREDLDINFELQWNLGKKQKQTCATKEPMLWCTLACDSHCLTHHTYITGDNTCTTFKTHHSDKQGKQSDRAQQLHKNTHDTVP